MNKNGLYMHNFKDVNDFYDWLAKILHLGHFIWTNASAPTIAINLRHT